MNVLEWFAVVGAVAAVIQLILYAVGCVRFCFPVFHSTVVLNSYRRLSTGNITIYIALTRLLVVVSPTEQRHEPQQLNLDHGFHQSFLVRTHHHNLTWAAE